MSIYRGLIRGFLVGVLLTVIVGGGIFYLVYNRVRSELTPQSIEQTAEEALSDLAGQDVQVGSGEVSLTEGTLSLSRVQIASVTDTFLNVERIIAYADGGLSGLKEGRFAQIRLISPTLSLERRNGRWNLQEFLEPILRRFQEKAVPGESQSAGKKQAIPLNRVLIENLDLTVTLEDNRTYSGIELDRLDLARGESDSVWTLSAQGGEFRLNPSAEEWPLAEASSLVGSLLHPGEIARAAAAASSEKDFLDSIPLDQIVLEDFGIELIHPGQSLSVGGLSFKARDFFEFLQLQTGSLEKKSLKSKV